MFGILKFNIGLDNSYQLCGKKWTFIWIHTMSTKDIFKDWTLLVP